MPGLHTYMVQRHRMHIGFPLTFSNGERIMAILVSEPVAGLATEMDVTVLVELPKAPGEQDPAAGRKPKDS